MSEGRPGVAEGGLATAGPPDRPSGAPYDGDGAADDEHPRIDVRPEDVWQPGPPPAPPRWAQRSFFAPVLRVIAISALLLYGLIAIGGALWVWLR